ncbi:hypothetical protein ACOMHN_023586 [Nucella lapillus]
MRFTFDAEQADRKAASPGPCSECNLRPQKREWWVCQLDKDGRVTTANYMRKKRRRKREDSTRPLHGSRCWDRQKEREKENRHGQENREERNRGWGLTMNRKKDLCFYTIWADPWSRKPPFMTICPEETSLKPGVGRPGEANACMVATSYSECPVWVKRGAFLPLPRALSPLLDPGPALFPRYSCATEQLRFHSIVLIPLPVLSDTHDENYIGKGRN